MTKGRLGPRVTKEQQVLLVTKEQRVLLVIKGRLEQVVKLVTQELLE